MPRTGKPFNTIPVVEIVIMKNDQILLSLKKKAKIRFGKKTEYKDGIWIIQGGAIEAGETSIEAAKREAYEESGVAVEIERLIQVDEEYCDDTLYIKFQYLGRPKKGEIPQVIEKDLFSDVKYFDVDELPENVHPVVEEMVQVLII